MVVNAIGMALAYLTHMLFARWLGLGQYGYYVYALAWLNVFTILVQLGMNTSTVRITAELRAQGNHAAIVGLSIFSTRVVTVLGVGLTAIGAIFLSFTLELMERELTLTLAVMLPLVVALSLLYQRMALLQGFERVVQAQTFLEIFRPLVLICVVGLFIKLFQVEAHWAMGANLIATTVTLIAATAVSYRYLMVAGVGLRDRVYETRAWLAVSLPYLVIGALTVVMNQSDVLMLGTVMGGAAAGLYAPAAKLAQLALFPMLAMRSRSAPLMAKLYAENNVNELQHQMNKTTIISALAGILLAGGLVWQREVFLGIFGADFIEAAPILVVLALSMMVFAVTGGVEVFLIFGPFERITMFIYTFVVVLNITLNLIWIPTHGVLGAAYATAVTVIARALISTFVVWRRTNILPWARLAQSTNRSLWG